MFKIWHSRDLSENFGDIEMNDLNLPIIKGYIPPPNMVLSMEEYLEFVQFNLENFFDREFYFQWKKIISVDVRFSLK